MLKPNRLIVKIILTSFFVFAGWGLIAPIFALFITGEIRGGSLEFVGLAVGIHWIARAVCQPFLAYRMDVVKGEQDDMVFLLNGTLISTVVPLMYLFAWDAWHIIMLEAIRGVGLAMVVPTLSGVLTRHVDKHWESYTWSLQNTAISFAAGFSAIFGGVIAGVLGFKVVFIIVSIIGAISMAVVYLTIKTDPWLRDGTEVD